MVRIMAYKNPFLICFEEELQEELKTGEAIDFS